MPTPDILWELNYHQRFPWRSAAESPVIHWPEGKRMALYVAINLEHFAFGCQEGARLSQAANRHDILNYSWRDYGNRVGAWYLADLFDDGKHRLAVLIAYCVAKNTAEETDVRTQRFVLGIVVEVGGGH